MLAKLTRLFFEAAALCVLIALFYFMGEKIIGMKGPLITNDNQPLFGDFVAYWTAGKSVLIGQAAHVYDHDVPTDVVHQQQLLLMPHLPVVAPWNSPPQFLMLATLLAIIPYVPSALLALGVSFGIYFTAARKLLPDWRSLIFAASVPAVVYEIGSIQTGIIVAGITGLAIYWQDKRPITAGSILAVLTIKPHMAILWPLYLLLTGRWRMFFAATASFLAVTIAAGFFFGFDSYLRFLHNLDYTQKLISDRHVSAATYGSLYGNLLGMGVQSTIAFAAHYASAALALLLAFFIIRKNDPRLQGAALCAATVLASPYLFFYDTSLLAVAVALIGTPRKWWEYPALIMGWGSGLCIGITFILQNYHLPQYWPIAPVCAWVVLLTVAVRAGVFNFSGIALARPAPAPQP